MSMSRKLTFACLAASVACASAASAETTEQAMPEMMDMLRHAISVRTVKGNSEVPVLARYLADKLEAAGFPKSDVEIIPVDETVAGKVVDRKAALVVRYPGTGTAKPIMLIGHMDVVAATNPAAWIHPPFELAEDHGYLYGRGVADMKTGTVALVETFMRLKREGFKPKRTIILGLTGDEENLEDTTKVLAKRFNDVAYVLNADGWGGVYDAQLKPVIFNVDASEKSYVDFLLTTTSPGGHSSEPRPAQNAIYRMANALARVAAYQFPVQHNAITLASLKAIGERSQGPLAEAMREFAANPDDAKAAAVISADPAYTGQLRTTCVATELDAGDARNALPKRAVANVNCRVFPGVSFAAVQRQLASAIADPSVQISIEPSTEGTEIPAPKSLPRADVMHAVKAAIHARFPGLGVGVEMINASSDCKHFMHAGVPCYGVAPAFAKPGDTGAHGINEKLLASEVPATLSYWHALLTTLAK